MKRTFMSKFLSRKEAAEYLGVHPRTIYKWEAAGLLSPSLKVNNRPRYLIEDLEQIIKRKTNSNDKPI